MKYMPFWEVAKSDINLLLEILKALVQFLQPNVFYGFTTRFKLLGQTAFTKAS